MRIFIALIIVYFLASCASVNGVFMKRKYTKGHYFSLANYKKDVSKKEVSTKVTSAIEPVQIITVSASNIDEFIVNEERSPLLAVGNQKTDPALILKSNSTISPKIYSYETKPTVSFNSKLHLTIKKQVTRTSGVEAGAKFVLYIILFLVLTLVYTLVIMANNPSFPLGLAIIVAMLGSLLTLLTGQIFI